MPTYDYECDACGHKFELFQSIVDKNVRKCPKCKKLKLRRLFGTGAALVFKGSGFYTTDYRSDSYKKAAQADSNNGNTSSSEKSSSDKGSSDKGSSSSEKSSSSDKGSSSSSGKSKKSKD